MGKGATILTHEEKLALVQSVKGVKFTASAFMEPPKRTREVEAVRWEDNLPLDLFRNNPGREAAIGDELTGSDEAESKKKNDAFCRSIVNRLNKVTGESWAAKAHDGKVWLRFAGSKNGK